MTEAEFKTRYPQFAANTSLASYFSEATLFIGEAFEEYAGVAQGLYVAHCCALEGEEALRATLSAAAWDGAATHKGVGRLSVGRSAEVVNMQAKDPLMRTTYGQRFCYLRNLAGKGAIVAGARQFDNLMNLTEPDDLTLPLSETGTGSGGETL